MVTHPGHDSGLLRRLALPAIVALASLALTAFFLADAFRRPVPVDAGEGDRGGGAARGESGPVDHGTPESPGGDGALPRSETGTSRSAPSRRTDSAFAAGDTDRGRDGRRRNEEYPLPSAVSEVSRGGEPSPVDSRPHAPGGRSSEASRDGASMGGAPTVAPSSPAPPAGGGGIGEDARAAEEAAPVETDPDSDRTPPVLLSLRMDPPQISDGGSTNLLIEISDDLSGVKSVAGRVRSPSGKALIPFEAQGASGSPIFSAAIPIPRKAETGTWHVADIFAYDQARNPLILNFTAATAPAGGRLLVSSADSDATPPSVREIWIDPSTISGGEAATIRIDIEDDRSGVANIWGTFRSRSGAGIINFSCRPQAGSGTPGPGASVWEARLPIPANADCGEWNLEQLWVADKAGNSVRLASETPQVARASFYVSSDACDRDAPVLERLTLSPTVVSNEAASEVLLTASVRDEGTGTVAMLVSITGPAPPSGQPPRISIQCARASSEPNADWIGTIVVPQFAAKGIWRVAFIRLQDRASNIRDYQTGDPLLAYAVFEVR